MPSKRVRETLTIGRYSPGGISLALAREKLLDAKEGRRSPALEKQRERRRLTAVKNFGEVALKWLADAKKADSARDAHLCLCHSAASARFVHTAKGSLWAIFCDPCQTGLAWRRFIKVLFRTLWVLKTQEN